ncbi:MAG: carboxypeptidase regulatory-like domain-containing protein [Acidobacteria bacterium]|nr:carboxypeptidase regulatory-like domain-containing protein [Acidobacteriota bacterium]
MFRAALFEVRVESPGEPPPQILVQGWLRGETVLSFQQTVRGVDSRYTFPGPAGLLDLRLAASGHQPIYFWDQQASGHVHSLGTHRWVAGSSVCGFVLDEDSGRAMERAEIRLRLAGQAGLPSSIEDAERRRILERVTRTNSRGFFQISGVEPGIYRLEAESKGQQRRLAVLDPIRVVEDSEVCFSELPLARASSVILDLTPSLDPAGQPWDVLAVAEEGETALQQGKDGRYESELSRGRYLLMIRDREGNRIETRELEVDSPEVWLDLSLDLVQVFGQVRHDGDPWPARLRVLAGRGDEHRLETDAEGRFRGWVRRPAHPMITFLLAPLENPNFERRLQIQDFDPEAEILEFLLEMGAGSIVGAVTHTDGLPAPEALVLARDASMNEVRAKADREGRFKLEGVEPGTWTLAASQFDVAWAEEQQVTIVPGGGPEEVSLRLEEVRQVRGRILLTSGEPVAGARVGLRVPSPVPAVVGTSTDVQGDFSIRVPSRASVGVLSVSGPVLWSGCVSLEATAHPSPMVIKLPLEGGTARLRLRDRTGEASAWRGFSALLTADGGFLSASRLASWTSRQGRGFQIGEGDGGGEFEAPNLAPGPYSLHYSLKSETSLAADTCAGVVPATSWSLIAPGGTASFDEGLGAGAGETFRNSSFLSPSGGISPVP